ncbi:hypothetical protein [Sporosarcina cyprini]|uniref:CDI toxin immunity protein n=1 Tax=Sporosarcina cyprini TaxID=2910523 RepID=UPI001EE0B968|nr:hypothetical protein [Sporosarcina cyprini]MCG3087699.1 hypothetical protein [Sporosarcina cyprini]
MNREERKKRLEEMVRARKMNEDKLENDRRISELRELFPAGKAVEILDVKESEHVETEMTDRFPIAWYGRIDWDKMSNKRVLAYEELQHITDILSRQGLDHTLPVYVIVGLHGYPLVKTSLTTTMESIEEIMYMGPDQYIYCPLSNYVIEFFHDDVITLGWL